jgi:hypothetical protein
MICSDINIQNGHCDHVIVMEICSSISEITSTHKYDQHQEINKLLDKKIRKTLLLTLCPLRTPHTFPSQALITFLFPS